MSVKETQGRKMPYNHRRGLEGNLEGLVYVMEKA